MASGKKRAAGQPANTKAAAGNRKKTATKGRVKQAARKSAAGKSGSTNTTAGDRKKTATQRRGRKAATGESRDTSNPARRQRRQGSAERSTQHARTASAEASKLTEARLLKMAACDYMNDVQLEFFRQRLLEMRIEAEARLKAARERLQRCETASDDTDRASLEEERWLELRLRERESVLINKINQALQRIARREYGYCEVSGEPIGAPRLLARPTATVCIDVKRDDEQRETHFLQ